ncbi:hypothetical protein DHEL01_v206651 [Diaporthe helianthi]|uniref:Methyltransferase n=1 Tax=Diaporthe helianthi TaxID=158607 RepID=A0A2P5HXI4_DIAHE|nr:hypothetical protein DHEL01_v206651 [Diaporthe helianthi]
MDLNSKIATHDVVADINYFPATGKIISIEEWQPRYLGVNNESTRKMTIRNIRGMEDRFSLDENGFKFVKLPSTHRSTDDDETIKTQWYPEISEVIRHLTGASIVHIFNHCIRQCNEPVSKGKLDPSGRWIAAASGHPHVDYAARPEDIQGTLQELKFPAEVAARLGASSRFAFVNAWRPIKTVQRDPLAVADASTVPDSDYQIRARRFKPSGVRSGNYVLSHGSREDRHAWYYMHEMRPDEVVVFRNYDTKRNVPGWRCPHTAFQIPGTEDMPVRESIEIRAVCFWD